MVYYNGQVVALSRYEGALWVAVPDAVVHEAVLVLGPVDALGNGAPVGVPALVEAEATRVIKP